MSKRKIINQVENESYIVTFYSDRNEEYIVVKSKRGWGYSAKHKYYLKSKDGEDFERCRITQEVAPSILENILKNGETEGFILRSKSISFNEAAEQPANVLHKLTKEEQQYTSRGEKLYYHWPIFKKYKETGYGSIIRATLTLHQLCSSHCQYCSTIARNKKDSISLDEAKDFVSKLYFDQARYNQEKFPEHNEAYKKLTGSDIRLKGLILSGGGQPNLWPHFEEFVLWLSDLDVDLGLITNGFPINIDENIYEKFSWIRLSITPEDASPHYTNGRFDQQYIPRTIKSNKKITFGLSYVYGAWTDDEILIRIQNAIKEWGADYCRLLTDCNLSRAAQIREHNNLASTLRRLDITDLDGTPRERIFHQLKYHGTRAEANLLWDSGQCYLQIYNVFWDTTGHEEDGKSYCYPCDSITVLSESTEVSFTPSARRFESETWGTVSNIDVDQLYKKSVKPYFDPRDVCASCLFMKNNQTVKDLVVSGNFDVIERDKMLEHINFP